MAMNIKNDRTETLARTVAERRGLSLTSAITVALERDLEHLDRVDGADRLSRLLTTITNALAEGGPLEDPNTALFDEDGLPA